MHPASAAFMLTDGLFATANYLEAVLWAVLAAIMAVAAKRRAGVVRARFLQIAAVLLIFGCSDVVEVHTGAWWRPWWLLVWKAGCVVALVALGLDAWRRARRSS